MAGSEAVWKRPPQKISRRVRLQVSRFNQRQPAYVIFNALTLSRRRSRTLEDNVGRGGRGGATRNFVNSSNSVSAKKSVVRFRNERFHFYIISLLAPRFSYYLELEKIVRNERARFREEEDLERNFLGTSFLGFISGEFSTENLNMIILQSSESGKIFDKFIYAWIILTKKKTETKLGAYLRLYLSIPF